MHRDIFAKTLDNPVRSFGRSLAAQRRLPYFRTLHGPPSPTTTIDGRNCVNLGSSNYLSLSGDRRVTAAAQAATHRYGTSVNGSRIMNGTTPLHLDLEAEISDWLGEEDALIFPTGYTTNLGVISALVGPDDATICDAGDHASVLDGAAMARGKLLSFQHNRLDRLEHQLGRARQMDAAALVVVDSLYSMQGDLSDLTGVTDACRRHGARLLVDEAHAVGVLGPVGAGVAALAGHTDAVDLRMGTFSKALAGGGGFVAGPAHVIDHIRVSSRGYLFTAAASPCGLGAAQAALSIVRSAEGRDRRERLAANAARLRAALQGAGFPVPSAPPAVDGQVVQTPILRVATGDDLTAVEMWNRLFDAGVYVNVALHPAVPVGQAQLRLSVQSEHTAEHLDRVVDALVTVRDVLESPTDLTHRESA